MRPGRPAELDDARPGTRSGRSAVARPRAFDPDVIAVSGTSTSTNRPDEPDRQAPGAPAAAGDGTDGPPPEYGNQSSPAATSTRRIRRRTDQSERASIEPARPGPRRRPTADPGQRDDDVRAAVGVDVAQRRVQRLLAERRVLQPERRVAAVGGASLPETPGRCASIDLDPAVDPHHPRGAERAGDRIVESTPARSPTCPDAPGVERAASGTARGPGMGTDRQSSAGSMIRRPASVAMTASFRPSPSTSSTSGLLGHGLAVAVSSLEVARSTHDRPVAEPDDDQVMRLPIVGHARTGLDTRWPAGRCRERRPTRRGRPRPAAGCSSRLAARCGWRNASVESWPETTARATGGHSDRAGTDIPGEDQVGCPVAGDVGGSGVARRQAEDGGRVDRQGTGRDPDVGDHGRLVIGPRDHLERARAELDQPRRAAVERCRQVGRRLCLDRPGRLSPEEGDVDEPEGRFVEGERQQVRRPRPAGRRTQRRRTSDRGPSRRPSSAARTGPAGPAISPAPRSTAAMTDPRHGRRRSGGHR